MLNTLRTRLTTPWMIALGISVLSMAIGCGGNDDTDVADSVDGLSIVTEPTPEIVAGESFEVAVATVDDSDEIAEVDGVDITLELSHAQFANGNDEQTATTDRSGIAEYDLNIEAADTDYVLTAFDADGLSATSQPFDVVAADAAAESSSIAGEGGVTADGIAAAAITVELVDRFGNPLVGYSPEFSASGEGNVYRPCPATDDTGSTTCEMSSTEPGDKTLELTAPIALSGNTIEFVACDTQGEPFGGGDGSVETPYRICHTQHLVVGDLDADMLADDFALYSDIDMTDVDVFEPIGSIHNPFSGTVDGAGFVISNLTIDADSETQQGLFGVVGDDGVIENLILEDVEIIADERAGPLAASNRGTIVDCHVSGSVTTAGGQAGGFIARNRGVIEYSSTSATVNGGDNLVGGFSGVNQGSISDSSATGNVVSDNLRVGGFVGSHTPSSAEAIISGSHATGHVEGGEFVGGFVGWSEAPITDCYATGDVEGGDRTAGLVGRNHASIERSYAAGDINGQSWVGGLVGINYNLIAESFATGMVTATSSAGGLVGRNYEATVTDSYAATTIDSDGTLVGALVGSNWETPITASYWDEDTAQYSSSEGGAPLSTPAFEESSNFEGWDFDDVWTIGEAPDGVVRPVFQSDE